MSGSGIERKYGLRAENLPPEKWREVVADMVDAHVNLINTFETDGFRPEVIYLFGSVALKGRGATGEGVVHDLRAGLNDRMDVLPFHPLVEVATNGDDSGIKGAEYAARELLAA